MTMILGVDPGSRKTGFGIIRSEGNRLEYVTSGTIHLPVDKELPQRLKVIFDSLTEIILAHKPDEMAIEQVFLAKSPASALKLGQARGAAIVAGVNHNLPVAEYEAKKVKQSVVGTGAASKEQVQHMVKTLLKLPGLPAEDAADALAVALCHSHTRTLFASLDQPRGFRRGRLK